MGQPRGAGQPRLHPRHPPLRRAADTVQLGLGPGAVVMAGLTPGQVAVLDGMDGSRSLAALHDVAAAHGDPPERVLELIGELQDRRLLVDPGAERAQRLTAWRRARHTVAVSSPEPLGESLARALTRAGVGHVLPIGWPALPETAPTWAPPHLVVLGDYDGLDPRAGQPWLAAGVTHLAVVAETGRVTVGPLVDPAAGPLAPCLRCLELHRCDRDGSRAGLLAQAAHPPAAPSPAVHATFTAVTGPGGTVQPEPLEPALLEAAAAISALVVAAYLSGDVLPVGVTVELSLPWPRLDHRRWARHPLCTEHLSDGGQWARD